METSLKKLGAEFYRSNRGGLITFHGPGQLVAYPILNLRRFNLSMRHYIAALEKTIINTCKRFNIDAGVTENTGVWVLGNKISAIGNINISLYKDNIVLYIHIYFLYKSKS